MADIMKKNAEIFRSIGYDATNQWHFYDERYQSFFRFLADNLTLDNLLSEAEVLEVADLKSRGQYLSGHELKLALAEWESELPGLFTCTQHDVVRLEDSIAATKEASAELATLIGEMKHTKQQLNVEIGELDCSVNALSKLEQQLKSSCSTKAQELEDLQLQNAKLNQEANNCFALPQTPALFMSQLPVEEYVRKCESFMQYFNQYVLENYKFQCDTEQEDDQRMVAQLEKLQSCYEHYLLKYIIEAAQTAASQSLLERLDVQQLHMSCMADLVRETKELKLQNQHLCSKYDRLVSDVTLHVQQFTTEQLDLVLYENTKLKLSRALERHDNEQRLQRITSDALSNAELLWITMQLDLERCRKRCDNSEQMKQEAVSSLQRIQLMRSVADSNVADVFVQGLACMLTQHLAQEVRAEPKACLYEYEKFNRLLDFNLQNLADDKQNAQALAQIREIKNEQTALEQLVFQDSPLARPMLRPVQFLKPLHLLKMNLKHSEASLRALRQVYREQVTERYGKDKFWRYSQQMWMWFLTEPDCILMAIEEVKKAAAQTLSSKPLGGLKRRE